MPLRHWLTVPALLAALAGACGGGDAGTEVDAAPPAIDAPVGIYRGTCDGSGIVALDTTYFLDVNDEDQSARIYARNTDGPAAQVLDLNGGLGTSSAVEADLEEVARIGDRLYVIGSHSRRASGALDRARYHFAAFDIGGTPPAITLTPAGSTTMLLDQMVDAASWDTPNNPIITALQDASQLASPTEPTLAAEAAGTNIEGMTADADGNLLIGFRNPRAGGAIVVALSNPDAVVGGQAARFAWGRAIDVGASNGLRGMTYADGVAYLIGGPVADIGTFSLYRWDLQGATELVQQLPAALGSPEAVAAYGSDIQVVLDMGSDACKAATPAARLFRDLSL